MGADSLFAISKLPKHVLRVNKNSYTKNYNFGYHSTDDQLKGNDTLMKNTEYRHHYYFNLIS